MRYPMIFSTIAAMAAAICLNVAPVSSQEGKAPTDKPGQPLEERLAGQREGSATARPLSMKYCAYFVSRDQKVATLAGEEWSLQDCSDFAGKAFGTSLGATKFQVFCVSADGHFRAGEPWERNPGRPQLPAGGNECRWKISD